MIVKSGMSDLMTWVKASTRKQGIAQNPFFTDFQNHQMSLEEFQSAQRQFYFAVAYFPRPMGALLARLPRSPLRFNLVQNLLEEHGGSEETSRMDPRFAHDRTFVQFLQSIGAAQNIESEAEGPAVRAFNTSLMGTCLMEPVETAFGCLGVIEYDYAYLSQIISKTVLERAWVQKDSLVHYGLHAEIDERHAEGFFETVACSWNQGGARRRAIEEGVLLGLHLLDHLYRNLWNLTKACP